MNARCRNKVVELFFLIGRFTSSFPFCFNFYTELMLSFRKVSMPATSSLESLGAMLLTTLDSDGSTLLWCIMLNLVMLSTEKWLVGCFLKGSLVVL